MKKFFNKDLLKSLLMSILITSSVLFFLHPLSCRLTEEGLDIVPEDMSLPCVEEFSLVNAKSLYITCSEKIVFGEIEVSRLESESNDETSDFAVANVITYSEDMKSAEIELSQETQVGIDYLLKMNVYDVSGNSLEYSQKFCGFNANPAKMIINEARFSNDRSAKEVEFIEFYVLKSGNTHGLEIASLNNGEDKKYIFPAIEVSQGDYICLHGKKEFAATKTSEAFEIPGCLDELGSDLSLSSAVGSCDSARDLWRSGSDKLLSQNDVLILRDSSGKINDGLLLSKSDKSQWTKKLLPGVEELTSLGLWSGSEISDAVISDYGDSIYRSVSRLNTKMLSDSYKNSSDLPNFIPSSNSDWIITAGSKKSPGATPGHENSSVQYVKS